MTAVAPRLERLTPPARQFRPGGFREPEHPMLTREFEACMDALTATVIREGNAVTLFSRGVDSYALRWKLLANARRSIHIVSFSLMRDETSYRLRDVLGSKVAEGIDVRLIFDDLALYTALATGITTDMVSLGARVVRYNRLFRGLAPDWRQDRRIHQVVQALKRKQKRRFHEKYLLVDGEHLILGGLNWGNKYAQGGVDPKAWRDSDVYLRGPVVSDVARRFLWDFHYYSAMNERRGPGYPGAFDEESRQEARAALRRLAEENRDARCMKRRDVGAERVRYVPHKPWDEQRLRITEAYLLMFRHARKYIFWGCHGIRPPRLLAEALAEAVERGVEVRLVTNCRSAARTLVAWGVLGWMYWESSNHYRWLLEHGIRLFEWQGPGAFHSKNLVIDGVVASVGSYNVARGSTFHHTESNVFVYGKAFAEQVTAQFEKDFENCREITLQEAKTPWSWADPFERLIHQRNELVRRALLTPSVRQDLDDGRYKRI